jgi:hypothetical protein
LQSGTTAPSSLQWLQATFVTGQAGSPSISTHFGHIRSMSMHFSKLAELDCTAELELDAIVAEEVGSSAEDDPGATADEDSVADSDEVGASLLVGAVASLDVGVSLPLLAGVSTSISWFTGDTLVLSSSQAASMNTASAAAAMPQVDFITFCFMVFLLFL